MATKTDYLHIRIKPEIKKVAQEKATAEGRSLSNYIEWLIKKDNGEA